jgi:hypothetical protein
MEDTDHNRCAGLAGGARCEAEPEPGSQHCSAHRASLGLGLDLTNAAAIASSLSEIARRLLEAEGLSSRSANAIAMLATVALRALSQSQRDATQRDAAHLEALVDEALEADPVAALRALGLFA